MRKASIQQAGYQAEVEEAQARARQAGPLADAQARQDVVVQETRVAELEAQRKEQQLQVEVRKPADARAYETVTVAQGRARGEDPRGRGARPGDRVAGCGRGRPGQGSG